MTGEAKAIAPIGDEAGDGDIGTKHETAAVPPVSAFVDTAKLTQDIACSDTTLDNDMMQHASLFVFYASRASQATRQFKRMKAAFSVLESRLDNDHRQRLKDEGAKATEAQISAAVKSDVRWRNAMSRLIDAETEMNLADDAKEAFRQRKDMILELARDRRQEKGGQLRVLEASSAKEYLAKMMREQGVDVGVPS